MAIGPSLRGTLGTYLPNWLQNVPGLRNLFSVLWTFALLGDGLREIAWQGQIANYPGVGTPTALPFMGATRGLIQGPTEPQAAFAARLRSWLAAVAEMGSAPLVYVEPPSRETTYVAVPSVPVVATLTTKVAVLPAAGSTK